MSEKEAALNAMRRVIYGMNAGDHSACLSGMSDSVVIVDDVAPFHRTGRQEAERWLRRLADTRKRLHASLTLEAADIREQTALADLRATLDRIDEAATLLKDTRVARSCTK